MKEVHDGLLRLRMLLSPTRAVLAELAGTAVLVMAVVGSGICAQALTDDIGVQLLINALATVAALGVLIVVLLPVSGAHLNPVVSGVLCARGSISLRRCCAYAMAQVTGAVVGTVVAHGMYERSAASTYGSERGGAGQWLGEVVATSGLVLVVLVVDRTKVAIAVPAWIGAAYFMTSSTSFANPAVTIGRALTGSFSGIAWSDVPWFVVAQLVGGGVALLLKPLLTTSETP